MDPDITLGNARTREIDAATITDRRSIPSFLPADSTHNNTPASRVDIPVSASTSTRVAAAAPVAAPVAVPAAVAPTPAPVAAIPDRPPHIITPGVKVPKGDVDVIEKVLDNAADMGRFLEIRPPIRRLPNETPFFIEMLDANAQPCSIQLPDGTVIQALKLAPNPDNLVISSAKIINKYNTMTRWVEEHWGDDMDTVSFSGSTFSFMSYGPGSGLTAANRIDTNSYQMLKALVKFYRMNGCIYQDSNTYESSDTIAETNTKSDMDFTKIDQSQYGSVLGNISTTSFLLKYPSFDGDHPRAGLVKERLYLKLTFDYVSFVGYFDSFDVTEDSANPFRMTYNALFKAERTKYALG
jgi:hypothetical protein